MNSEINQKISRFLDDELNHSELHCLLQIIQQQPELMNKVNRYSTVSQTLKTGNAVIVNNSFLHTIQQQIEQEPHYLLPQPQRKVKKRSTVFWQRSSLAVAASALIVTVLVFQNNNLQQDIKIEPIVNIASTETVPIEKVTTVAKLETVATQPNQPKNVQHDRLKAYLRAHSGDLYTDNSSRFHPYAQIATYAQD